MRIYLKIFLLLSTLRLSCQNIEQYYLSCNDSFINYSGEKLNFKAELLKQQFASDPDFQFFDQIFQGDIQLKSELKAQALSYYLKAYNIIKNKQNKDFEFLIEYKIGKYYLVNDNLTKAMEHYNKAFLVEPSHSKNFYLNFTINLESGLINAYLKQHKTSTDYYLKAYDLAVKKKDLKKVAHSLNNMALNYIATNDSVKAIEALNKSIAIRIQLADSIGIGQSYNNFGQLYTSTKNYNKALSYYHKSLNTRKNNKAPIPAIIESEINIAKTLEQLNQRDKAISMLESCIKQSVEINHLELERRATEQLLSIYADKKMYDKAFHLQTRYHVINDSLYGLHKKEELNKLNIQHLFEKKQQEDSLNYLNQQKINQKEIENKELKEKRLKIILYIVAIAMVLLAIMFFKIYQSNKKITLSNNIISTQRDELQTKQKEITDSINYAKRLQEAILPPLPLIKKNLPNSFVYYMPKDIVAGDFYWMHKLTENGKEIVFIAAADCTGHGVPGALVSVVCSNALNRAVKEFHLQTPSLILDKVRELVIETFEASGAEVKDGMDISLLCIESYNESQFKIQWAGANNPLLIIDSSVEEKNTFKVIKANKQPIGKYAEQTSFTNHEFEATKGTCFYMYTDGYPDQFGGEKGKKFKYKKLEELLLENHSKDFDEQLHLLNAKFINWKGNLEQVDDVCVVGIRI